MQNAPLAEKLRPITLKDYVGQEKLVGKDSIIRKLLNNRSADQRFPSMIFWGPPGTGKTTLARIISNELRREFYEFSAVNTKVKEIEEVISSLRDPEQVKQVDGSKQLEISQQARNDDKPTSKKEQSRQGSLPPTPYNLSPIIFLDEIHRFNKAQQDKLLPHVEKGDIILIGATTENPSFEVIAPLLSRCRILILEQLSSKELKRIELRALKFLKKKIEKKAETFLLEASNGDARVMLNVLEIASSLTVNNQLLTTDIEMSLQRRQYTFDKNGEDFYNLISSYIKSMRASDVDASLYYLARMVEAGQDPLYIARRMVVFASEDVSSPTALVVANAVFRACETVGYPECQENLAAGTVYLAQAKKDRSAYEAYMKALSDVRNHGNLPVPMKIRNPVTKLMKEVGYGEGYDKYTKDSLLPEKLKNKKYYQNENEG